MNPIRKGIMAFQRLIPNKFIRFLFVGGLNTAFGMAVYCLCIFVGIPYFVATLVSNVLGVCFNFVTTGNIVFENGDPRLILRFVLCYVAVYLINTAVVRLLILWGVNDYWAGIVATPVAGVCSFFLLKSFVYRKKTDKTTVKPQQL
jgi:putative flippase GtrA